MTDTEPPRAADAALRHPHPDLHPADVADDLTGNTERGAEPADGAGPADGGEPDGTDSAQSELLDDAAELTDSAGAADDRTPGDGTVGSGPPLGDVDALRTAERGRGADAARADTRDSTPTPTETHGG